MENLYANLSVEWLGALILAPLVGLLIGLFLGWSGKSSLRAQVLESAGKLRRAESRCKENERTLIRMRSEHDTVANLAMSLPHVVRDMNRNDLDPADVPRLILQLANAIFQPGQVLLYGVQSIPEGHRVRRELKLIAHRGLSPVADSLTTISMGQGKIGWIADHELDMLAEDWDKLSRNERITIEDNDAAVQAEIIGPLVHHAKDRQQLLGVLCIGALGIRPRDPKLMFQMVTNFGSLALVNSCNMKKLREMANHDGLTGLVNKRCFLKDHGSNALVDCERRARPFSIFIFDIDHFKNYNDTNGHPAGDELLRQMGALIKQNVQTGDVAARYGGEEFIVAMPETDREAAYERAETIRQAVANAPFAHRENQPGGRVSVSGGVASFPKHGHSIGELIQHADEALYRSKEGGRNRVTIYKGVEIGDSGDDALTALAPALDNAGGPGAVSP